MSGSSSRKRPYGGDEEITDKLDLLREPPTQSQVTGGRWTFHRVADLNPTAADLRIVVSRSEEEFTDLSESLIVLTYQITQANGNNLDNNPNNVAVNQGDFGDLLFSSGQMRINNTLVEYVDNYGIVGYAQTLLSTTPAAKRTRLSAEGWFEDDARGTNHATNAAAETARKRKIIGSRTQTLVLKPKFALCQQRRMFPPGTEFEFLLKRSSKAFFLSGANDAAANGVALKVFSAEMRVRRYSVDGQVYAAMLTAATGAGLTSTDQASGQFVYPYKAIDTTEHTITAGTTSHTISIPNVKKPNKVLVLFLTQAAHAGAPASNPVHFENLTISQAELKFDGVPVDQEINCDFRAEGSTDRAYANLFEVAFRVSKHDAHGVDATEFRDRSTIFAWNTQDLIGSGVDRHQTVGLSLTFKMRDPTANVCTALVIRETGRRIHVGADGTAQKDVS